MSDSGEVFVPDQVRRQAARADELQRELAGEGAEISNTTTVVEGAQPSTEAEDERQPEPQPIQAEPDWQQRYRTLQGKYDAEVGAMRGQIGSMERLLATMQQPQGSPAPTQQLSNVPVQFNEADVELYGEDLLEAASRAAEAKLEARYGRKVAELEQHVKQLSGRQEEDRVFRELDSDPELVGRWRNLNTNQHFIDWLQQVDEMAGVSRNTMLQHAYANGDAMRTGRFFKKYMAEHTAPPPTATAPQTAAPARYSGNGHAAAGGLRLEDMAAPGRAAGSGSGNGAPQQRLWSRPDITAFYRARTMGKFKGREAEAEQLEADLLKAGDEGRLV